MNLVSKSTGIINTYSLLVDNKNVVHTEWLKENGKVIDSTTIWADNEVEVDEETEEKVIEFVDSLV